MIEWQCAMRWFTAKSIVKYRLGRLQSTATVMHTLCWLLSLWRHRMETFSALLALCAGNSPVTDEFPSQRPVTWSFIVFFDLRLNKRLSEQSWGWWFDTPSRSQWRHCNERPWRQRVVIVITLYSLVPPQIGYDNRYCHQAVAFGLVWPKVESFLHSPKEQNVYNT